MALPLLLLCSLVPLALGEQLTHVQSRLENSIYLYPNQLKRDNDLPECGKFEVCSAVHKRFWLPQWVHRFCRCPTSDCSENISSLDNRSTLKACKGVREQLSECGEREWGLEVQKLEGERRQVKVSCRCNWPNYWQLAVHVENATITHSRYACQSLRKCEIEEFCGHVRADIYSIYLQCWCPEKHICVGRDKQERNVTEALYHGPALRAYCTPLSKDSQ